MGGNSWGEKPSNLLTHSHWLRLIALALPAAVLVAVLYALLRYT